MHFRQVQPQTPRQVHNITGHNEEAIPPRQIMQ